MSRDKGRDDPGQSWDILRQLLAIGVPITVGSVSLSVINLLDQSITMGILQTSWGLTEAEAGGLYGVYSYAGNLFALPAAFIYPMTISLIPAIGAALARGNRASAGRHTAAAFRLTALLALPAGVGLSVLARPILELLYPAKGAQTLAGAAYHLQILGIGSIFVCLMALSNGILQAYGREKIPLWSLLAGGGLASIGFLHSYWAIFAAIALSGVGAALFHPEGARFANKVSGASKGTGLSLFSIGGNSGFVFGPMLAVAAIGAFGLPATSVFGLIALVMSVILLYQISHLSGMKKTETESAKAAGETEEVKNNWKELNPVQMLIYPNHSALNSCWHGHSAL